MASFSLVFSQQLFCSSIGQIEQSVSIQPTMYLSQHVLYISALFRSHSQISRSHNHVLIFSVCCPLTYISAPHISRTLCFGLINWPQKCNFFAKIYSTKHFDDHLGSILLVLSHHWQAFSQLSASTTWPPLTNTASAQTTLPSSLSFNSYSGNKSQHLARIKPAFNGFQPAFVRSVQYSDGIGLYSANIRCHFASL